MRSDYRLNSVSNYIKFESQRPSTKRSRKSLPEGDMVLVVRRPMVMTYKTKGKFQP